METSETVGRYKILEKLGSGSSGVFKGADSETGKSVVLKLVPDWLVEQYGPSFLSRLEKEVQASTRLKHPRIVQIFGFEAIQDHNYIVMEFVEGCDLPKETGVAVADAVCLGVQLLAALEYGHEQGVVHRNVKPSNILLSSAGTLKLADYGVGQLDNSIPGADVVSYRSPEQYIGAPADRRSDVFSAAVVIYELLTGKYPFTAGPGSHIVDRICNEPEPPPSKTKPDLNAAFDPVLRRALAKAVYDRYPTARAFSEDLQRAFATGSHAGIPEAVGIQTVDTLAKASARQHPSLAQPPVQKPVEKNGVGWDNAMLREVERQLTQFVGPVAKIIVMEAAARTQDLDRLYALAAASLESEDDRNAFLAGKVRVGRSGSQEETSGAARTTPRGTENPVTRHTPHPAEKPAAPPVAPFGNPAAAPGAKRTTPVAGFAASAPKASVEQPVAMDKRVPELPSPQPAPGRPSTEQKRPPESLADYIAQKSPELDNVVHLFIAVFEALVKAYETDPKIEALTPQNIRISPSGDVTIRKSQGEVVGPSNEVNGAALYAAPESFAEKADVNTSAFASHVYALGFMFYEILLGKKLFESTFAEQKTDLDWLRWHADLQRKAPTLTSLLSAIPIACSDTLAGMMEKDTSKRMQDPKVILARLRSIASQAEKTMVLQKPPRAPASHGSATSSIPAQSSAPPKRKSRAGIVLVLLLVVLAAVGAYLWLNPDVYENIVSFVSRTAGFNQSH